MRGESKYHYVDLSLEEDQQDIIDKERAHSAHHRRLSESLNGGRLVLHWRVAGETPLFLGASYANTLGILQLQVTPPC